ncbi:hypothetical protein TrRE_jg12844 [Triparma retinervis]|uniref:Uncharacterized protein n=1 Tax=Triparma retinervis TaxID=2557542 RepID=A0A9W7A4H1_9STRA|nr:hypothetical protein TrRE_jg12844 [Triparma retinervis]
MGEVEEVAKRVDKKWVNEAKAKAKIIRGDLEAAGKARKGKGGMGKEDEIVVKKLYQQFKMLEKFGDELPVIVERLVDLNALHQEASTFGDRIEAAESAVAEANLVLKSCETSLAELEKGMGGMLQQVRGEVEKLGALVEKKGGGE